MERTPETDPFLRAKKSQGEEIRAPQNQEEIRHELPEWKSWTVKKPWTIFVLLLNIAIVVSILVLQRLSTARNGIVTIPATPQGSSSRLSISVIVSNVGLLWTTLPSFIMGLNRLAWDSIISGAANRQPYIELRRELPKPSNVARSILPNYSSSSALYSWILAFNNGHWVLGFGMALNLLLSVFLVPTTAYLLAPGQVSVQRDFSAKLSNVYNVSQLTTTTDTLTGINAASAHWLHGATPPPWITAEYAFEPFSRPDGVVGNITVDVNGYSGYLDCQIKSKPEVTVSEVSRRLFIDIDDRGCRIPTIQLPLQDPNRTSAINDTRLNFDLTYARTWSNTGCSDKARFARLGLLVGMNTVNSQDKSTWNLTAISCIPSFWETRGALTVTMQKGLSATGLFFLPRPGYATELDIFPYKTFIMSLPSSQVFDTTDRYHTDAFGRAVFDLAQKKNPGSPFENTTLLSSTEQIFTSMMAYLSGTTLFSDAAKAQTKKATVSVDETRLFVINPVAFAVVVIMILVIVCNIWLIWYTEVHPSVLYEEPNGILPMAGLIYRLNIFGFVTTFFEQHPGVDNIGQYVRERYDTTARCFYDEQTRRVRIEAVEKSIC